MGILPLSLAGKLAAGGAAAAAGALGLAGFAATSEGIRALLVPEGPQCVVEVIGCDLNVRSNGRLDRWTGPDVVVECRHGKSTRRTQVEYNSFQSRFYYSAKMPYVANRGFAFTVYDRDVMVANDDEVVGWCYVDAATAKRCIDANDANEKAKANSSGGGDDEKGSVPQPQPQPPSLLLSLGDGIVVLQVQIRRPKDLPMLPSSASSG